MSKFVLIAGKDSPDCAAYISAAVSAEREILVTIPAEMHKTETNSVGTKIVWNRSSPISAHSLMVQAKKTFGKLDEALLIFDSLFFAERFTVNDAACFTRAVDETMLGYFYIVTELLSFFNKQGFGRITFLLKAAPESAVQKLALPVLIAQDTFVSLSTHCSAKCVQENSKTQIIQIRDDNATNDSEIADWLFSFLDSIPLEKKRSSGWHKSWHKINTKNTGGFSFFK